MRTPGATGRVCNGPIMACLSAGADGFVGYLGSGWSRVCTADVNFEPLCNRYTVRHQFVLTVSGTTVGRRRRRSSR